MAGRKDFLEEEGLTRGLKNKRVREGRAWGVNTWAKARGHDLASPGRPLRKEQTVGDRGRGRGVTWGPHQGPEDLQGVQRLADGGTRSPHQGSLAAGARETRVRCRLF